MDYDSAIGSAFLGKLILFSILYLLYYLFIKKDDEDNKATSLSDNSLPLERHVDEVKVVKEAQQKSSIKQPAVVAKASVNPKVREAIVKLSYTARNRKTTVGFNKDIDWRKEGLLSLSGYRVGKTKGVKEPERRKILKSLYQDDDLLDVSDKAYAQEWGSKFTPKRYKKLNDSISTFLYQAEKRNKSPKVNLDLAISQWKSDIGYLKSVR